MNRTTTRTVATPVAVVVLALCLLGLALVPGCGRPPGVGLAGSPATAATVAPGKATGRVRLWAMGVEAEQLPDLVEAFEQENPGVTVTVTPLPWDAAHDKFTTALAAGRPPDVAAIGTTWMGEFAALRALEVTPESLDRSVFFPAAQRSTEVLGTSYGVPWYVETRLLYYRTDLAARAGIHRAPQDWSELTELARAYQEKTSARWGINLQPGQTGSWQSVLPLAWSNGATLTSHDQRSLTLDTPEMVDALAYYQSFFTSGLADPATNPATYEQDFVSGRVPMVISGPWMMGLMDRTGGAGFSQKYAVAPLPKAKRAASYLGGADLVVFTRSANRDSAWKLVQYLSRPATQVAWFRSSAALPSVMGAWNHPLLSEDPRVAEFGAQLVSAQAAPTIPTWERIAGRLDAQIERVCREGLDPATAMKQVQADAASLGTGG